MSQTKPDTLPKPGWLSDDLVYLLPMMLFMIGVWAGGHWLDIYPLTYLARAIAAGLALAVLWKRFTRIRWERWWLGIPVGVLGVIQWVTMQTWLQDHFAWFTPPAEVFNPIRYFDGHPALMWSFILFRWLIGASLVVPVMEELFWRDFVWRSIISYHDFKLAKVGEWNWRAFVGVALAFSLVHGNWWLTAIVWAAMMGWLLVRTRSLGACIVAHAVTNFLLGAYVLFTRQWNFW